MTHVHLGESAFASLETGLLSRGRTQSLTCAVPQLCNVEALLLTVDSMLSFVWFSMKTLRTLERRYDVHNVFGRSFA